MHAVHWPCSVPTHARYVLYLKLMISPCRPFSACVTPPLFASGALWQARQHAFSWTGLRIWLQRPVILLCCGNRLLVTDPHMIRLVMGHASCQIWKMPARHFHLVSIIVRGTSCSPYVCTHLHSPPCACMHARMHAHTHARTHPRVHACAHTHACTHARTDTHSHTHTSSLQSAQTPLFALSVFFRTLSLRGPDGEYSDFILC